MICFIPTKSRPKTNTYQLFESAGIPFLHFVEPQEYDLYNVPNKVSIGSNDKGISFVRNFMLDYAKDNNHKWVIFCDDDVSEFGLSVAGKCSRTSAAIWFDVLNKATHLPFELYGINYRQYAWREKKEYNINNKFVEVCVLANIENIRWKYRPEFDLKEDRDFVLQCIKYGYGVVKFNKLFYNTSALASKGGLQKHYQNKKDEASAKKMLYEWQPFVTLFNKKGRIDAKIDIKGIASKYNKKVV